ncbi:hypothetical protein Lesp02_38820 [Lentzea sp. NBRC 105346]|nr:hypothetical protein Lesp02_38820 [Lentzea sp. NBRC 105346]
MCGLNSDHTGGDDRVRHPSGDVGLKSIQRVDVHPHPLAIAIDDVRGPRQAGRALTVSVEPDGHNTDNQEEHRSSHGTKFAPDDIQPTVADPTMYANILPCCVPWRSR